MKKFNHRSMLRSAARRIWMWSPARKQAIRNARVSPGLVACKDCQKQMKENAKEKEYRVDHIIPASEPAAEILDWNDFFERLFECGPEGHQILCKPCHDTKTKAENKIRKSVKPKRKRTRRIRKTNG